MQAPFRPLVLLIFLNFVSAINASLFDIDALEAAAQAEVKKMDEQRQKTEKAEKEYAAQREHFYVKTADNQIYDVSIPKETVADDFLICDVNSKENPLILPFASETLEKLVQHYICPPGVPLPCPSRLKKPEENRALLSKAYRECGQLYFEQDEVTLAQLYFDAVLALEALPGVKTVEHELSHVLSMLGRVHLAHALNKSHATAQEALDDIKNTDPQAARQIARSYLQRAYDQSVNLQAKAWAASALVALSTYGCVNGATEFFQPTGQALQLMHYCVEQNDVPAVKYAVQYDLALAQCNLKEFARRLSPLYTPYSANNFCATHCRLCCLRISSLV